QQTLLAVGGAVVAGGFAGPRGGYCLSRRPAVHRKRSRGVCQVIIAGYSPCQAAGCSCCILPERGKNRKRGKRGRRLGRCWSWPSPKLVGCCFSPEEKREAMTRRGGEGQQRCCYYRRNQRREREGG
ncbi:hypothetical protein MTR67_048817, partial [Solanum verrucosum]